jgi:hypothetical protein
MLPPAIPVVGTFAIVILLPTLIAFSLARMLWSPLGYVVAAFAIIVSFAIARSLYLTVERGFERKLLREFRASITRRYAEASETGQVAGVRGTQWIASKQDHDENGREYRRLNGRNAGSPPVEYRLMIATCPHEGSRDLAFTDGKRVVWNRSRNVIHQQFVDKEHPRAIFPHDPSMPTQALLHLAETLTARREGLQIFPSLPTSSRRFSDYDVLHAAFSGLTWGIFRLMEPVDLERKYQQVRDSLEGHSHSAGTFTLQLTDAGRVWCDCDDDIQRIEDSIRSAAMGHAHTQPSIIVHGPVYGNVAGRDVNDRRRTSLPGVSTDDLLSALAVVLAAPEVPWQAPTLRGDRATIEAAARDKNPRLKGLKAAVRRVIDAAGEVGIGATGNATYEILKTFIS